MKIRCVLYGHDFEPMPQWAIYECSRCGLRWSRLEFLVEGLPDPLEIYQEPLHLIGFGTLTYDDEPRRATIK
jgi:hypothetical protein